LTTFSTKEAKGFKNLEKENPAPLLEHPLANSSADLSAEVPLSGTKAEAGEAKTPKNKLAKKIAKPTKYFLFCDNLLKIKDHYFN
jgi:hypothetical protein